MPAYTAPGTAVDHYGEVIRLGKLADMAFSCGWLVEP
jgi:hypothetical protein